MLKRLVLAGLLAALPAFSRAQSTPAPATAPLMPPDSLPKQFGRWYIPHYRSSATVADTAAALVSLFATKRLNAWWYLPAVPLGFSLLLPNKEYFNDQLVNTEPPPTWQVCIGIPMMVGSAGAMALRWTTYSRRRLEQVQHDYEAGKPIPARLRRRLRARHFAQAGAIRISIVQAVQQQQLKARPPGPRK